VVPPLEQGPEQDLALVQPEPELELARELGQVPQAQERPEPEPEPLVQGQLEQLEPEA
jgi:hypothetical protein